MRTKSNQKKKNNRRQESDSISQNDINEKGAKNNSSPSCVTELNTPVWSRWSPADIELLTKTIRQIGNDTHLISISMNGRKSPSQVAEMIKYLEDNCNDTSASRRTIAEWHKLIDVLLKRENVKDQSLSSLKLATSDNLKCPVKERPLQVAGGTVELNIPLVLQFFSDLYSPQLKEYNFNIMEKQLIIGLYDALIQSLGTRKCMQYVTAVNEAADMDILKILSDDQTAQENARDFLNPLQLNRSELPKLPTFSISGGALRFL